MEERFEARLKLAELPRNSQPDPHPQPLRDDGPSARLLPQDQDVAASRCASSASQGLIPGLVKSSW